MNPVKTHILRAPGLVTQPLNLKCDILVSKFAFKWVNMYRYAEGRLVGGQAGSAGTGRDAMGRVAALLGKIGTRWGLYKLKMQLTHSA